MRNLKKILALVLSLMMVLSVMVTASAADYSDADDIQYTEAVELMSALGILKGADGKFVPQGTLYRDQAAKIVAFIKLGVDTDSLLKGTGSDQFVDVTGGWAYDYVSFCANEGIINGYTVDGKLHFGPGGTLTGYQFGKMVLNAAGIEGNYTGAGWELRVATALKDSGLKAGLETIVLSANITREQACQLAFNAMNYEIAVESGYVVNYKGTPINEFYDTLADAAAAANALNGGSTTSTSDYQVNTKKQEYSITLIYTGYKAFAVNTEENGLDGYYWAVKVWYNPVTDVYVTDDVLSVTTDGTSVAKLTSPKGTNAFDATKFVAAKATGYYTGASFSYYFNGNLVREVKNGDTFEEGEWIMGAPGAAEAGIVKYATSDGTYGTDGTVTSTNFNVNSYGKGVTVKLVDGDGYGYATKVLFEIPEYTTVTKIKSVAETKTEGAYTLYTFDNGSSYKIYSTQVTIYDLDEIEVYDGIAVKDHVILTDLADTVATVVKAETVTGAVTAASTADHSFTINGTKYYASGIAGSNVSASVAKTEVTFVLDSNGYLVKNLNAAADPIFYVAVAGAQVNVLENNLIVSKISASVMYADGSVGNIVVAKVGGTAATTSNTTVGLYSYVVNDDGEYELTAVTTGGAALTNDTTALSTNSIQLETGVYANNSTKYVYAKIVNGKLVGTDVYEGYANYVTVQKANGAYLLVPNTTVAATVFVLPGTATANKLDFVWYLGTYTTNLVDGAPVASYDVIVDGVTTTLVKGKDVSDVSELNGIGLYKVNAAGKVETVSGTANTSLVYSNGLLSTTASGTTTVTAVDADVPVYVMNNTTGVVTTVEASDLTDDFTVNGALTGTYSTATVSVNGVNVVVAIYVVI